MSRKTNYFILSYNPDNSQQKQNLPSTILRFGRRTKKKEHKLKSYLTEGNGVSNETKKWILIRMLDMFRTYKENHVDHTHLKVFACFNKM